MTLYDVVDDLIIEFEYNQVEMVGQNIDVISRGNCLTGIYSGSRNR